MSRERSFNMIRTAVSMLVAILVAFVIILIVSDQPVESIKIFLVMPFSSGSYLGNIVETAVPLIFSGLAMAVMFKARYLFYSGSGGLLCGDLAEVSFCAGAACGYRGGRAGRYGGDDGARRPEGEVRRERDGNIPDDEQYPAGCGVISAEQFAA